MAKQYFVDRAIQEAEFLLETRAIGSE